ncbi:uncharacterized protein PFLUO_LOCUS1935 [Penicillium psychrofluorescens]|uniref:uncharacterized protein n=1 Tax=Penicillium psychrofluorescens TaxID=3158075 RepID=UPI003CCE3C08
MTATSLVMQNRRGNNVSAKRTLRLPIIAPKEEIIDTTSFSKAIGKASLIAPRIRLPPRSRTGCWTCRSRKVKCDEGHPQCNQCARLGHICDYRPRLAFRDDTPRIMGRMADVQTAGNIVWDLTSPTPSDDRSDYFCLGDDSLPPFSLLTTDEERERKAEATSPGTYHVVVVPDSFSTLPEYADDGTEKTKPRSSGESQRSADISPLSLNLNGLKCENVSNDDPNLVILKTFEDATRRSSSIGRISRVSPTSEISDPLCSLSLSPIIVSLPSEGDIEDDIKPQLLGDLHIDPHNDYYNEDTMLFAHFRDVVWRQLFPTAHGVGDPHWSEGHGSTLSVDLIEREAAHFPPLSHAIRAVSALSLSLTGAVQHLDALQYYQQAFPSLQTSLRNNDDLVSDGLFLTHFLLLIYEVAAAEPHGSNLWSHHISRLLHISFLRRDRFGREPHPFVLWWVCHIDLYALLSGAGTGEFVRAVIDHQMLPSSDCLLSPSAPEGYSVIYGDESNSLPTLMRLYYDSFMLAARLGFLASRLRHDKQNLPYADFDPRSEELGQLRQSFGRLWEAPDVAFCHRHQDSLPTRSRDLMQQSIALFHVCHLFSYSSMWPAQRLESEFSTDGEIDHHASEILRIAEQAAHAQRADRRFLIFPLFLAGATASASGLKMMAMELMSNMEDEEEMGRNAATTRAILQVVYERQLERLMRVGHTMDVDWVELMAQERLHMVNFGF